MPKPSKLVQIWKDLSTGLQSIYGGIDKMPPQRYMDLYTQVFNYCSSTQQLPHEPVQNRRGTNGQVQAQQHTAGAEFMGSDLYSALRDHLTQYAQELSRKLKDLHGEQLLQEYTRIWESYRFGSTVVNGIFSYLNRHWIRREIDEGKNGVYEVYNLTISIWKQQIFDELHHNITSATLALIEQDRKCEKIQTRLVKGVVESYTELGINEREAVEAAAAAQPGAAARDAAGAVVAAGALRPSSRFHIYREFFVRPMLDETRNFYTRESTAFLNSYSVPEYMKKVEDRLNEERDRCQLYLDHSTLEPLLSTCDEALIAQHLERFHNEFEALLNNRQAEHLGRMYDLCLRVPNALDKLKQVMEAHIVREGRTAVEKIAVAAMNDSKQYIMAILELYNVFNGLVVTAFKQDHGFVEAMDKAFTRFVNDNQITRLAKSASKSPQLLVQYCDQLLRKSARNVEDEKMDEYLEQVMTVFKYVEDKDMFQAFFHKSLCKRLVTDSSASEESERSMIAKLKHMCGFEYTSKLERLLNDVAVSRENSDTFRRQHRSKENVDFSVIIVMSNVWPLSRPVSFEIPQTLMTCIEEFRTHYTGKYSGRKLNWVLQMSRGELTSVPGTFTQKYSFTCNTQQISVLMLYNRQDAYTVDELSTQLNMPRDQLLPVLQSLTKVMLLEVPAEAESSTGGKAAAELAAAGTMYDTYKLNLAFTNKKLKVDLIRAMGKEQKKDSEEVQKSVDEDRKIVIQAAIVRIMKMRKQLKHQQLVGEVLNQLTARFQPKVPMVKKCIDMLIEKEYLKRADSERDTYEYLA